MDVKKITKKQFEKVYNQFSPNWWARIAFKYFSKNRSIKILLISAFLVGFIATVLKLPKKIIGVVTLLYGIVLAVLVLSLFAAVFMNNARIRKIRKALGGLSKVEYNNLVDRLYKKPDGSYEPV